MGGSRKVWPARNDCPISGNGNQSVETVSGHRHLPRGHDNARRYVYQVLEAETSFSILFPISMVLVK